MNAFRSGFICNAESNVSILLRLLGALQTIASFTTNSNRRCILRPQVEEIAEVIDRTIWSPLDRDQLVNKLIQVREALDSNMTL